MDGDLQEPVEGLCRIQCVCKRWRSLTSSAYFTSLRRSFTTPPNRKLNLRFDADEVNGRFFALYTQHHKHHDVHFPFRFVGRFRTTRYSVVKFTCLDVIHGLVCISYTLDSGFNSALLWNPTIRKYVALPYLFPPLDTERDHNCWRVYFSGANFCHGIGFGYDESKNDFKVVRIWTDESCDVYSTQEGLWRRATTAYNDNIESCDFINDWCSRTSCFVNGTIHWLVQSYDPRRYLVLMFDCGGEELTTTELPQEMFKERLTMDPMVLEYAGMLSIVINLRDASFASFVELWAMEEHGVANSWQRLYRFWEHSFSPSDNNTVTIYNPSYIEMAPYGPDQWCEFNRITMWFYVEILSHHVYEESMVLMDDPNAQSYTKEEIVEILSC